MGSRKGGIRNFSMKKFGTPSGAGPGLESENVGLCGVGLPSGLVNTSPDGARRSLGAVRRRGPPVAGEAGCSDPRTGAPVEPGRRLGWPDGAGEEEPDGDGDWEPPDGGGEGDGDGDGEGVTGVLGSGTGGVGSGRLGVGGSVGVVTGPIVTAGAGRVP